MIDTHVHSTASGHAYSTLEEIAKEAKIRGIEGFVLTDHAPAMPGGAHIYHFHNMRILPTEIHGVKFFKGAELNIISYNGEVDIDNELLNELEVVVASYHIPTLGPATLEEHTYGYLKAMENPNVNIIGHPDDSRYKYDVKKVVTKAGETGTFFEVNNTSLLPTSFRIGANENYKELLLECKKQGVFISLGSDTHFSGDIGRTDASMKLLKDLDFPMDLVANLTYERFVEKFKL